MEVKLIDFGALKQEIAEVNKSTSIILKYGFAPPEQYTSNSRGQGAWTDIYAVGATVYYILTGLIPQDSVMRMMKMYWFHWKRLYLQYQRTSAMQL